MTEAINQKPLTIYKASAGSGKTFTLAVEYIRLLVADPENFKYILAVTFTNKATDEMKRRILANLYGIAHKLPSSENELAKIREAFPHLSEETVRKRCGMALDNILAQYNLFRVQTIDKFFQTVVHGLSHELGLTSNLSINLNDKDIQAKAVDKLLEGIKDSNNETLNWIMTFVSERMEENKSWNVVDELKDFSNVLSKEVYIRNAKALGEWQDDAQFFLRLNGKMKELLNQADTELKQKADAILQSMKDNGIGAADIRQGQRGVYGYIEKISNGGIDTYSLDNFPNSFVRDALDDPKTMVKSKTKANIELFLTNQLGSFLKQLEKLWKDHMSVVATIQLTRRHLNQLRLLRRIEREIKAINDERNSFQLSSTQRLLSSLIENNDAPFVYEKIGGQIKYIMIDEFQDTSGLQWQNFKVLIDDCIAHDNGSLIVGDAKQSIYRWRSGDWTILQSLADRKKLSVDVKTLDYNYRTEQVVVDFNNRFFTTAAKVTCELLTEDLLKKDDSTASDKEYAADLAAKLTEVENIYKDVCQKVPERRMEASHGSVCVELLPTKSDDEVMPKRVAQTIKELLEAHVPLTDICIITRTNMNAWELANFFQQNLIEVNGKLQRIPLISDEAFRLDASQAVMAVVNAMRFIATPNDELAKATLMKTLTGSCADGESILEELTERREFLLTLSLTDLARFLYRKMDVEEFKQQSAYVCTFMDCLQKYTIDNVADLRDFLDEWDKNICSQSISCGEGEGVRLMTIHKSKGLERENIIFPYCDWQAEKTNSLMWVTPHVAPFNELPIVPVAMMAKLLRRSYYRNDYATEHIYNFIDSLNLLYVGFTRAKHNLFVFGTSERPQYASQLIKQCLDRMVADNDQWTVEKDEETGAMKFRVGELFVPQAQEKVSPTASANNVEMNVFNPSEEELEIAFESAVPRENFLQSNESEEFVHNDDEVGTRLQYIKTGNILHLLFSKIRTVDDVERAVQQLEYEGKLYGEDYPRERLLADIKQRLALPHIRDWFTNKWQIINERNIILPEGAPETNTRPDRVMVDGRHAVVVDFKTGSPSAKHQKQVQTYCHLLKQMGYQPVEGFLWYLQDNNIIPVTDE